MAGQTFSWIADKFLAKQQQNNVDLGRLRAFRRFDFNNLERATNDLTGRLGSASQRLAIAKGLQIATQGLIIGGQRDGRVSTDDLRAAAQRTAIAGYAERQREQAIRDRRQARAEARKDQFSARKKPPSNGLPPAPA